MAKKAKPTAKKTSPQMNNKETAKKPTAKKVVKATKAAAPKKVVAPVKGKGKKAEPKAPPAPIPTGIQQGAIAPDFSLPDTAGRTHRLSDYHGKRVVLYFYPKDNTPGCTIEACDFRDKNSAINATGAITFGISPDNAVSHQKFITKYNLGFTLLCDIDKEVAKEFKVWKEKNNYGQTYWGIERTTFIIDEEGKFAKIFPKVQVQGHVEHVLEVLKSMPKLQSVNNS